jgi:hypothetical protein
MENMTCHQCRRTAACERGGAEFDFLSFPPLGWTYRPINVGEEPIALCGRCSIEFLHPAEIPPAMQ